VDEPDDDPSEPYGRVAWGRLGSASQPVRISRSRCGANLIRDCSAGVSQAAHCGAVSCRDRGGVCAMRPCEARIATGINQVALSGGCMHNRRLARLLRTGLKRRASRSFSIAQVSPGDGGLSYGQVAVAARMEMRGMRPRTMATSSQRCRRGQFWQSLKILSGSSDLSSTVRKPYLKKKSGCA
jgi:hypothetical protein